MKQRCAVLSGKQSRQTEGYQLENRSAAGLFEEKNFKLKHPDINCLTTAYIENNFKWKNYKKVLMLI